MAFRILTLCCPISHTKPSKDHVAPVFKAHCYVHILILLRSSMMLMLPHASRLTVIQFLWQKCRHFSSLTCSTYLFLILFDTVNELQLALFSVAFQHNFHFIPPFREVNTSYGFTAAICVCACVCDQQVQSSVTSKYTLEYDRKSKF